MQQAGPKGGSQSSCRYDIEEREPYGIFLHVLMGDQRVKVLFAY